MVMLPPGANVLPPVPVKRSLRRIMVGMPAHSRRNCSVAAVTAAVVAFAAPEPTPPNA
jgi:hypothetical protein